MLNIPSRILLLTLSMGTILNLAYGEERNLAKGEQTYQKICGYCHDAGVGPQIKGRELPASYTIVIARNGYRAMPAFPMSHIDDATLLDTAKYIEISPQTPLSNTELVKE